MYKKIKISIVFISVFLFAKSIVFSVNLEETKLKMREAALHILKKEKSEVEKIQDDLEMLYNELYQENKSLEKIYKNDNEAEEKRIKLLRKEVKLIKESYPDLAKINTELKLLDAFFEKISVNISLKEKLARYSAVNNSIINFLLSIETSEDLKIAFYNGSHKSLNDFLVSRIAYRRYTVKNSGKKNSLKNIIENIKTAYDDYCNKQGISYIKKKRDLLFYSNLSFKKKAVNLFTYENSKEKYYININKEDREIIQTYKITVASEEIMIKNFLKKISLSTNEKEVLEKYKTENRIYIDFMLDKLPEYKNLIKNLKALKNSISLARFLKENTKLLDYSYFLFDEDSLKEFNNGLKTEYDRYFKKKRSKKEKYPDSLFIEKDLENLLEKLYFFTKKRGE